MVNKKSDGAVIDSYSYTYDNAGNMTSKVDSKGTTSYEYDGMNRLSKVSEPGSRTTCYQYDHAGNRTQEYISTLTSVLVTDYFYDNGNRLNKTVAAGSGEINTTVYVYDNNGNNISSLKTTVKPKTPSEMKTPPAVTSTMTKVGSNATGNSTVHTYDVWNQLIKSVSGANIDTYAYNADGLRTAKTVNGTLTRYVYEGSNVVLELDSSGVQTARNVYGTNLLMRTVSGQSLYYMYNGHGDVTSLLDITTKSVSATYYYDAFGNIQTQTGTVNNNITYAGYQYDSETGLYYLNARYYDAKIARFLTEDTYTGSAADPLSLNLYTYCVNDPIMYTDPTGHIVMEYGSRGDGVVALQEMLNKLGYSCGSADGVYGNKTEASVIQYQRDYGLTVDGIVGNQTLTTLKTNVNVMNAPLQVQQTAMASAANAEVGGINDDTILMSNTTFNNTLNTIENTRISTGCTVNTTVVNNKVVVTGLGDPIINTVKPSNTVVPTTTQGTGNSTGTAQGIGISYIEKSLNQLAYGNYTNDVTILGTGSQILTGIIGIDLPADVRDITADLKKGDIVMLAIDTIAIFPVVGSFKYVDEVGTLIKNGDEITAAIKGAGKTVTPFERGRIFEKNVLDDFGWTKNTKKIGKSIPDAIVNGRIKEIKDVKYLSMSKQFREYVNSGKPIDLIVNSNTKISKPLMDAITKSGGTVTRIK